MLGMVLNLKDLGSGRPCMRHANHRLRCQGRHHPPSPQSVVHQSLCHPRQGLDHRHHGTLSHFATIKLQLLSWQNLIVSSNSTVNIFSGAFRHSFLPMRQSSITLP